MHELLLHASVPAYRQKQVLNILAGIAAMQPQTFHERHLVYKPTRQANRVPTQVGGSQAVKSQGNTVQATMQGDLFFLHVVEDLAEEAESERGGDEGKASEDDAMDGIDGGETTDTGAGLEEKVCWKLSWCFPNEILGLLCHAQFLLRFLPLTDGLHRKPHQ